MDHKEAGQGTPFDGMAHEDMLAWLDKANSSAVQGASDRLVSAAKEIRKIAEELKVRPQMVEWKGEGADAFRTWSADLANATLRLGAYSEGASKWLAQASDAIASAQAAIPRTQAGAQANLEAARAARNDPDASAVAQKSAETLIANQESNRQEAAAQMRKLAQTYSFSASQMDGLEKPAFPPPPGVIVPERTAGVDDSRTWAATEPGAGPGGGTSAYHGTAPVVAPAQATNPDSSSTPVGAPVVHSSGRPETPVGMGIDSVVTLLQPPSSQFAQPQGLPVVGRPDGGQPPFAVMPPVFGGGPTLIPSQSGNGKYTGTGVRPPSLPGQVGQGPGTANRMPRESGITGGRPVAQNPGRPTGGLPRGTVVGSEGAHGRSPMGHGGSIGGSGAGQNGISGGRRSAGESGGIIGGRPQQPGRSGGRPFTPGGTGLLRGKDDTRAGQTGRGVAGQSGARRGGPRRDEDGERPDYLIEDEETWQQGGRRIVPPVID